MTLPVTVDFHAHAQSPKAMELIAGAAANPGGEANPHNHAARPHPLRRRVPRHQRPAAHDGPRADRHAGGRARPRTTPTGPTKISPTRS